MNRISKKKRVDGVSTYVSTIICVLVLMTIFIMILYFICSVIKINDVDRVSRKYILRMERVGYLTTSDESTLKAELENMGATNIDTSGSSSSPVGYGNTVTLIVKCDIPILRLKQSENNFFEYDAGATKHYERTSTGTAFY